MGNLLTDQTNKPAHRYQVCVVKGRGTRLFFTTGFNSLKIATTCFHGHAGANLHDRDACVLLSRMVTDTHGITLAAKSTDGFGVDFYPAFYGEPV